MRKKIQENPQMLGNVLIDQKNEHISTIVHEFAHLTVGSSVFTKRAKLKSRAFWKEAQSIYSDYRSEVSSLVKLGDNKKLERVYLGSYAGSELDEFVAEAFTQYKLNQKPTKYANKLGRLFDKHFKR